tara:strand:- start:427 stop:855 length:429 start_codon:yes stop_codon:yes gene_type:complete
MQNIIQQCKDKYFELGPSKIHGIGIIAIRSIPKETFLFEYKNKSKYIPYDLLYSNGIQKNVIKSLNKNYAHDKKGIELSTDINNISYVNYINHSNNHNVNWINKNDLTKYYTNRRIKKGEELCINYLSNNYCVECLDFKDKS